MRTVRQQGRPHLHAGTAGVTKAPPVRSADMKKSLLLGTALLLAGCHSQPTIEQTNSTTNAQLAEINATTNESDGMDQGNDALMATPTTGQQMDAKAQPPK